MLKRQGSRILLYGFLIGLPFLIMVAVNTLSPAPTHDQHHDRCTRYCHDHPCPHTLQKYGETAMTGWKGELYQANINWLKTNPFGLSYTEVNLLIYVILLPGCMALLLWGAIRKRKEGTHG